MFDRLLYASLQNRLDLEKSLFYPLAPESFSSSYNNGKTCKIKKSVNIDQLKKHWSAGVDVPPVPNIHVNNGFCLLHSFKNVPGKYKKNSEYILNTITLNKIETQIIFRYAKPSIEDYEHHFRDNENSSFDMRGESKRQA